VQADLDRLDTTLDRLLALAEAEHRVSERRAGDAVGAGAAVDDEPPDHGGTTSPATLREDVVARWGHLTACTVEVRTATTASVAVAPDELAEMVDTVVDNAVKYAGAGALVVVHLVDGPPGRVEVLVDDDGDGLSEEELARVGTRFWRSARHARQPGTGLGLALVGALARAHDGAMHLARSPQGGLRVRLDLPAAP